MFGRGGIVKTKIWILTVVLVLFALPTVASSQAPPSRVPILKSAVAHALSQLERRGVSLKEKRILLDAENRKFRLPSGVAEALVDELGVQEGSFEKNVECPTDDRERFEEGCRLPAHKIFLAASVHKVAGDTAVAEVLTHRADEDGRPRAFGISVELVEGSAGWRVSRTLWTETGLTGGPRAGQGRSSRPTSAACPPSAPTRR
jgi:hypothetical protein